MHLTAVKEEVYYIPVLAKSSTWNLTQPLRAQRRSLEALFLRLFFLAGRMGHLRVAAPLSGCEILVWPATLFRISPDGGSSQLSEDTAMDTLIPIASRLLKGIPTETVSAKRLHEFLGVGRDFSNWIKGRIQSYNFESGIDYITTNAKTGVRSNVKEINYFLTIIFLLVKN